MLKLIIFVVLFFRILDVFRVFDLIYVLIGGGFVNLIEIVFIYIYKILFN